MFVVYGSAEQGSGTLAFQLCNVIPLETYSFWYVIATGYTEYYFDAQSGKVCRHVEHWNVPKMALLKQLLRPTRGFWLKRKNS
ncbi:hypothetical protein QQP08_001566 [Theobroma cacao]|nr:hypothetical protein QQP08_001566 [Theobroma cacao]